MARWDRIIWHGRQYVPADDYDRVVEALQKIANNEHAEDCGGGYEEPGGCFGRVAREALDPPRADESWGSARQRRAEVEEREAPRIPPFDIPPPPAEITE